MKWISIKDKLPNEENQEKLFFEKLGVIMVKGHLEDDPNSFPSMFEATYDFEDRKWICVKNIFSSGYENCYYPEDFEYEGKKFKITHWVYVEILE